MAIAFVQAPDPGASGSGTSLGLAFVSNVTAGNSIIVGCRTGGTTGTVTVADNLGNTYVQDAEQDQTDDLHRAWIFSAHNVTGGACTVTVTVSVSSTLRMCIAEYSGLATSSTLDKTATAQHAASTTPSSGATGTLLIPDELVVGASTVAADSTYTAGSGYTRRTSAPSNAGTARMAMEDKIVAATTGVTADWTLGASTPWAALVATYKAASAAAGQVPYQPQYQSAPVMAQ